MWRGLGCCVGGSRWVTAREGKRLRPWRTYPLSATRCLARSWEFRLRSAGQGFACPCLVAGPRARP
eukprot:825852-Alexandrium_andersonii.AAC.1